MKRSEHANGQFHRMETAHVAFAGVKLNTIAAQKSTNPCKRCLFASQARLVVTITLANLVGIDRSAATASQGTNRRALLASDQRAE